MKVLPVLSSLPDDELLSLIRDGDERAFVAIYDRYWSEMYACAYHLFPHRETCEDLIHDVFLYLWTTRHQLNIRSIRDYLYIAIKNKALNKIRGHKPELTLADEDTQLFKAAEEADEKLMTKELNLLFDKGLHSLPDKCRQIMTMSRKEHLSNKEIAARLNLSTKTVENQINIGLKKMRVLMDDFLILYFIYFFFG